MVTLKIGESTVPAQPGNPSRPSARQAPEQAFGRIVVGVDGSEAGFEACRQAGRLAPADARIDAVAVVHLSEAVHVAFSGPAMRDQLRLDAEEALGKAEELLGGRAHPRFVNGFVVPALIRAIDEADATLVALGFHGHTRISEILLGGVAGEMLHKSPCSVLIARRPTGDEGGTAFPRSVVVGIDGSRVAGLALEVAVEIAQRFGAELRVVAATGGGEGVDLAAARAQAPRLHEAAGRPVPALVAAAGTADLLVVGSRGLHGLAALGSVSERVAHRAPCSVLVVRDAEAAAGADTSRDRERRNES